MKFIKISMLLAGILLLTAACHKKPKSGYKEIKIDQFTELQMDQGVFIPDEDFKLTFTGVPEDSRCPKFTNCIQEGQVRVTMTAVYEGKTFPVEFTRKATETSNNSATVANYKVQLFDVQPFPESGKKINLTDYKARLVIRKIN